MQRQDEPAIPPAAGEGSAPGRLPRAVIALGWVSLLTDAASDMIYPLVPRFLASIGGGPLALGWLEGVAEAVSAVLKLVSGRLSDRPSRRKPLIAAGYGLSALTRPLFAIAAHPLHAVVIRALDRVGKGLRGPPRDAMLASLTSAGQRGHAFGFHRMMDNLGGVLGGLVAFAVLQLANPPLQQLFAASIVPGALAVLVVLLFVRGQPAAEGPAEAPLNAPAAAAAAAPAPLPAGLKRYFAALALFSLAGSGDLFLMNRLTDLGLNVALVPVAWISLQLGKSLLNVPGGRLADRLGRRRVLAVAWALYAVTYAGFGVVGSWAAAWLLLGLYAMHYGLAEGAQRALVAEYAPARGRGSAYGLQLALEGGTGLVANVGFGLAYQRLGPQVAFAGAGAIALGAAAMLRWAVPDAPGAARAG